MSVSKFSSKPMQPFFYFSFFTFEYTSPVLEGSECKFDISRTFEVEVTEHFL